MYDFNYHYHYHYHHNHYHYHYRYHNYCHRLYHDHGVIIIFISVFINKYHCYRLFYTVTFSGFGSSLKIEISRFPPSLNIDQFLDKKIGVNR